jgi:hypothetical protein
VFHPEVEWWGAGLETARRTEQSRNFLGEFLCFPSFLEKRMRQRGINEIRWEIISSAATTIDSEKVDLSAVAFAGLNEAKQSLLWRCAAELLADDMLPVILK